MVDLLLDFKSKEYADILLEIPGLETLVKNQLKGKQDSDYRLFMMEFVLFGLVEYSYLSKHPLEKGMRIDDLLGSMISGLTDSEDDLGA